MVLYVLFCVTKDTPCDLLLFAQEIPTWNKKPKLSLQTPGF